MSATTSAEATRKARVLVVDDEEVMQDILAGLMRRAGFKVDVAGSGEEALERAAEEDYGLALVDLMLPGKDGLETLSGLKKLDSDRPVIMITAYGTIENAIEAMRRGAFDYLLKPFRNDEVVLCVQRALEERRLREENRYLKKELRGHYGLDALVGKSPKMRSVYELIEQVAPSRSTILIEGESGTGKELVARAIHNLSPRVEGRFVVVNSAAMPADLLESNLFGHMKGSFTGAVADKRGLFEIADCGSLFFDEISNVGPDVQVKLLRVLQEREFMAVGGTQTQKSDVRIIAATNVDLWDLVKAGTFREDLYYRIHVIRVRLPPLRERREDLTLLVNHFVDKYSRENNKKVRSLTPDVMRLFEAYDWPGNVRELENVVQRAVVLARSEDIGVELVSDELRSHVLRRPEIDPDRTYKDQVESYERQLIAEALERAQGVQKKAAELLGLKPTTLHEKLRRLGIK